MLIWVCALHCEAKPVIDYYRLKKSHEDNAFDLYRGEDMLCIITGTGKLAAATACAWVAGRLVQLPSIAWINLGTAGAAEHDIGSLFLLNQVIDADTLQRYYPAPALASKIQGAACLTVAKPDTSYREGSLSDMEASGFMHACLRFSTAELLQSIKVVSDNRHHQTGRDRQQISDLLFAHIEPIDQLATALLQLNREIAALTIPTDSWEQLTQRFHLSQTQKNQLQVLWRYLVQRGYRSDEVLLELQQKDSAAKLIHHLEQLSQRDAEAL